MNICVVYTVECDCALFLVLLVLTDIYTLVKCVYDLCNVRIITPSVARRIILELLKRESLRRWRFTCDMFRKTKRSRSSTEGSVPRRGGGWV
jgi:hypothetical protein